MIASTADATLQAMRKAFTFLYTSKSSIQTCDVGFSLDTLKRENENENEVKSRVAKVRSRSLALNQSTQRMRTRMKKNQSSNARSRSSLSLWFCTRDGTWTRTSVKTQDFKSCVSTNSTTQALKPKISSWFSGLKKKPSRAFFWAKDGSRTRDLNLGKVTLYQLSYFRFLPGYRLQNVWGFRLRTGCKFTTFFSFTQTLLKKKLLALQ